MAQSDPLSAKHRVILHTSRSRNAHENAARRTDIRRDRHTDWPFDLRVL